MNSLIKYNSTNIRWAPSMYQALGYLGEQDRISALVELVFWSEGGYQWIR